MFDGIRPGLSREIRSTVEKDQTVSFTGTPVLSTPQMISIMEVNSAQLIKPLLPPDYVTVGYEVCVKHKAPARLGDKLKVFSRLTEVNERRLLFEVRVETEDDGKLIGEGTHRRTIIPVKA